MRAIYAFFLLVLLHSTLKAQELATGLWNAGRSFSLTSPQQQQLILHKHQVLVQLYPGFAVVKQEYDFSSNRKDTINASFHWQDTLTTPHTYFGQLHGLPSFGRNVLMGKDTILTQENSFSLVIPPVQHIRLTTYQLCPTNQAKLSRNNGLREQNGLIITNGNWEKNNGQQVLVELKGDLTQLDLIGVYPAAVEGNRTRLRWVNDRSDSSLVLWYNGAAPDYKFEKKVVPQKHNLFEDIDTFNPDVFATEKLSAIKSVDFSTNAENKWTSTLYFILFSIPWIMLLVFIIYLIKKPKK